MLHTKDKKQQREKEVLIRKVGKSGSQLIAVVASKKVWSNVLRRNDCQSIILNTAKMKGHQLNKALPTPSTTERSVTSS